MKRLVAAIAAVAMVVGAIALRDRIDGDDGDADGGPAGSSDTVRLMCATELADVCDELAASRPELEVTDEDPGATSDRLVELPAGEDPGFDAWLVDGPWPAVTADNRSFADVAGSVLGDASEVLARSPAVVVVPEGVGAELAEECGATIGWRCLGERAGSLRIGLPTPERGDGLVLLGEAAGGWFGTTDYATNDLREPGFAGWFDDLTELSAQSSLGRRSPLEASLVQRGLFDVVGALESQVARLLRGREGFRAIYPDPMTTADVALVPRAGLDAQEALDRLGADALEEALAAEGWRTGTAPPSDLPDGSDPPDALPDGTGLPSAGVLQQLRELW